MLIGYDCPSRIYPSPAIPIILEMSDDDKGQYKAVYLKDDLKFNLENVDSNASFSKLSNCDNKDKLKKHFDYRKHRLFALSETKVEFYEIEEKNYFFIKLLIDKNFSNNNRFFRVSLAKDTGTADLLERELQAYDQYIQKDKPHRLHFWEENKKAFEAELQQLRENTSSQLDKIPVTGDKASKVKVDYTTLRNLLQNKKFLEADQETAILMLKILRTDRINIKNFPKLDLRTIDKLWVIGSDGKFGLLERKSEIFELIKKYNKFYERIKFEEWINVINGGVYELEDDDGAGTALSTGIPVEDVLLATITRETKKVQTGLLLAGDIGGTKTILRLVETSDSSALHTIYQESYHSADFPDLVPIVQQFLLNANTPIPEKACFVIADPIVQNTAKLTNLAWFLDTERLEEELGIPHISLINDFAAIGYGILGLQKQDLLTLQVGKSQPEAPIAIIGAGTGLGQGFLIKQGNDYQIFSSEGGHADFAPRNEIEFQLLKYLLGKHDIQRLSVERVVSGMGIVAIYQFLRDRKFATESPDIAQVVRTWEQEAGQKEKSVDAGAVISTAALQGSDRLSEQTLQLFIEAYGAEAGNLALKLLPYGGLYIAGGIAPKILPLIQNNGFLLNFTQKGRMRRLLEDIPVYIILNSQVGLIGAALCAAKLGITVPKRENCTLRLKAFPHKHLRHAFFNNTRK